MEIYIILSLVLFLGFNLFVLIFRMTDNSVIGTVCLIFFICAFISLPVCCAIDIHYSEIPENKYKTLVEAKENADKDLQKFLVDHPEFKEEVIAWKEIVLPKDSE